MFQCNSSSPWHEPWPHCTLFLSVPPPLWLPLFFLLSQHFTINTFQAFMFTTGLFVFHFPFHSPSCPQPSGMWSSKSTSLILSSLYPTASVASLASYIQFLLDCTLQSCQTTPLVSHHVPPWIKFLLFLTFNQHVLCAWFLSCTMSEPWDAKWTWKTI